MTGYKKELLATYELTEFHNDRWFDTNMVASLACADEWLKSEPSIISYSDIFYETSAVNSLINCPEQLAITFDPDWLQIWKKRFRDPLLDAETFSINSSNEITDIGNKPSTVEEIQGQYMGLLKITPESWQQIGYVLSKLSENKRNKISMTSVLQKVIKNSNLSVIGVSYEGDWGEIDSKTDLQIFNST